MHFNDNMDATQANGAVSANSSSDFVSRGLVCPWNEPVVLMSIFLGAQAVQVRPPQPISPVSVAKLRLTKCPRMLEDPSYSQVVRWGDDGGSFVVLEVC